MEFWLLDSTSRKDDVMEGTKLKVKRRLKNYFKIKHANATPVLAPI